MTGRKRCCGVTDILAIGTPGLSGVKRVPLPIDIKNAVATYGNNSFNGFVSLCRPSYTGESAIEIQVEFRSSSYPATIYWIIEGN